MFFSNMINRIIIRIKVLQVVYAYYQKGKNDILQTEKELLFSIQKSYDLYHYLLLLISLLTDMEQKRQDIRKHKFLATSEEKNPNTRFTENRLAQKIRENKQLSAFANEKGYLWDEDSSLLKKMLDGIINSDLYKEYLLSDDTFEADRDFWKKTFKNLIFGNEEVEDFLEEKSIYWNDDTEIVGTFALKSIKKIKASDDADAKFLPMFKDDEDRQFAIDLLHRSILDRDENTKRISDQIRNWDAERIAATDMYIMQMALAEILSFPSIPVSVSLNEYIDMAKHYSSPKSGTFINGILDAIVTDLRKDNLIFKNQ